MQGVVAGRTYYVAVTNFANRAFDALPLSQQQALRVASARAKAHFEDIGRTQED